MIVSCYRHDPSSNDKITGYNVNLENEATKTMR